MYPTLGQWTTGASDNLRTRRTQPTARSRASRRGDAGYRYHYCSDWLILLGPRRCA